MKSFSKKRERMVNNQLKARDINDDSILEAFSEVPREKFIPGRFKEFAYADRPLPIGYDVTISQPYIVAKMCQILRLSAEDKVLDIGTGSGYEAAILSKISREVVTIERVKDLAEQAEDTFDRLNYHNIKVVQGDGSNGYAEEAPYDSIKVAAATEEVSSSWTDQLKVEGRIIFPKKKGLTQRLIEVHKTSEGIEKKKHTAVRFVPLIEDNKR